MSQFIHLYVVLELTSLKSMQNHCIKTICFKLIDSYGSFEIHRKGNYE